MEMPRIHQFLEYYSRLRQRTRNVVDCIPDDLMEWRPAERAFSFADIIRHVAAIERYMFAENAWLRPSLYPGHGPELAAGATAVRAFLDRTHRETLEILVSLTPDDLRRRCTTPGDASIPVWKWLRALAEHEIHHRGQIYLMLRLNGVATPPLYGLTSEQVRQNSDPFWISAS
jgi:uncharacterized damage-inducible protein DinB